MSTYINTLSIVSIYTGVLVCDSMDEMNRDINWILRRPIQYNQLPAAADICRPILEEQFTWLEALEIPDKDSDTYLEDLRTISNNIVMKYTKHLWVKNIIEVYLEKLTDEFKHLEVSMKEFDDTLGTLGRFDFDNG